MSNGICVGFIGLGMMGWPMASRLSAAGYRLVVRDALDAITQRFFYEHAGVVCAAGLQDFAACQVVITMLPNSDAVDATVLGAPGHPGLLDVLNADALVIDMGSSQPLRTQALAQALAGAGKRFLDAPVSGGVKRAVDGSLAIMVGGDEAVFASQRGLLLQLGKVLTHVGPAGAGHAVKALNNYVSAAGLLATVEALHVGQRFGLDPAQMTDVFNSSTGRNNTSENKVKPFMLSGRFDSGFSLALMAKDLATAASLASSIGTPMRLGEAVLDLWAEADTALGHGADHTEMYRWFAPRSA
jgi:3-hydroxyisobutyrate dehydrogenase